MNTSRRRGAVVAGVLASVSVVALGTSTAASQSTQAAVPTAPAADSAREHWQPPTHQNQGPGAAGTAQEQLNTDYLINDVTPAQFRGSWYQSHIEGINVTWMAPSGRDAYDGWDWIEIVNRDGKRVAWDWACGNAHCAAYGSTLIDVSLQHGAEFKARYWSDGGRVTKGHLQAEFEFWV
ncbi:hypothetical protein ACIRU3_29345 [Streptomyces sp. NPDC101151]|uniref:hypothetical protein n=1 Tax=Streptomyces sp. NPDC101151 TaxID=3366115 RepID=UPI00381E6A3F